ncbi:LysE/ArgO family amino acid transporter [Arthrobacter roseus]|uniref:LysE/ArgO family amino acid transporter n=1 Tax=Arthrobacter roseus TaxID=136274 RepID=UPI0030840021|nr:L-lysine exporter family protein LysE/ArgO [Arthrobacter roseus]
MNLHTIVVDTFDTIQALLLGLGSGLVLIIAIGAQNAFLLRHGIQGRNVTVLILICAVSDAILITLGILGVGAIIGAVPALVDVVRLVGAAFLIGYALLAAKRALRPGSLKVSKPDRATGMRDAVLAMLAITWLNPHVYLDTVMLLGTLANRQGPDLRWWFGAGAIAGSFFWFSALGFGARKLRRFFAKPSSWRILDGVIAVVMLALGLRMAFGH